MQAIETPRTVVHVVQHLQPGGLEVMALELARVQSEQCSTVIVSLEGSSQEAIAAWPRLADHQHRLVFLNKKPGLDVGLVGRLVQLFRRLRPDAVHTHHIGPLLYAGTAARIAGVKRRIHTEHDAWHLSDPRRRLVARLAMAAANPLLIADAPPVADAVAKQLNRKRPSVVLNGIDTDIFAPIAAGAQQEAHVPVVGIAARLEAVKGVDVAIRAMAQVMRPMRLVIAGSGTQKEALSQLVEELGVGDRVTFLGHIDRMADFYRSIDVMCLPSRSEGLPLSLLEAQACGVRVVASAVGGVPDAVCPETGLLVAPEDPAALARGLEAAVAGQGDPRPFVLRIGSLRSAAAAYLSLCAPDVRQAA